MLYIVFLWGPSALNCLLWITCVLVLLRNVVDIIYYGLLPLYAIFVSLVVFFLWAFLAIERAWLFRLGF